MDYWLQLVKSERAWPAFLALLHSQEQRGQSFGGHIWAFSYTDRQHLRCAILYLGHLAVIKQNPKKVTSDGGKLAAQGHKVFQVTFKGKYIGMIVDGVYQSY